MAFPPRHFERLNLAKFRDREDTAWPSLSAILALNRLRMPPDNSAILKGLDTATRMAADAAFVFNPETSASVAHAPDPELDQLDELIRFVSQDTRPGYRIQFLGPGTDQGPAIWAEVEVRASDVSAALREAAHLTWPKHAIGFRLVGRAVLRGQEVSRRT